MTAPTARQRANYDVARVHLFNAGLTDHGCVAAYYGALFAGANGEIAFEAARQHALLEIPADDCVTHSQRRYQYPDQCDAAMRRLDERRRAIESLPNPFALQVAA